MRSRARAATDFTAARAAGAAVDAKHTSPAFYFPSSVHKDTVFPHILLDRAKPGLIAVNSDGRRFVNEADSYHDFVEGMFRANAVSPSVPAWLVCDRIFHPGLRGRPGASGRRQRARSRATSPTAI